MIQWGCSNHDVKGEQLLFNYGKGDNDTCASLTPSQNPNTSSFTNKLLSATETSKICVGFYM
jgi:hypothetical protein